MRALPQDFGQLRSVMVETQLKTRDIKSESVLDAMLKVPRHLFVPDSLISHAYDDSPLSIGLGQTISQPYIVAYMTEHLELAPGMKVLEIGTGSGYQTAVLACLGCEVYSIECVEELADRAKETLSSLGYGGVNIKHGNGYLGWPDKSPFDAAIITAAPEHLPDELVAQLKDGGKMIVPISEMHSVQWLKLITKTDGEVTEKALIPVRFVPMVR